jgi:hypothetical protein
MAIIFQTRIWQKFKPYREVKGQSLIHVRPRYQEVAGRAGFQSFTEWGVADVSTARPRQ